MRVVIRVLINCLLLLTWPLWALRKRLRKRHKWVELALDGAIEDVPPAQPQGPLGLLARLRSRPMASSEVRTLVARLAADPSPVGLLLTVRSLRAGWATLHSLQQELRPLGAQGKQVVCFLEEGGTQRELMVAGAASGRFAPPSTGLSLLGARVQRTYVAPLLSRLGLSVQVVAQGRYKTAAEALVRTDMSEAEREQSAALVSTFQRALSEALTGLADPSAAFGEALFSAERGRELGFLQGCVYRDELEQQLGIEEKHQPLTAREYLRSSASRRLLPLRPAPRVAIVSLHGPIGDVSSSRSISLKATRKLLTSVRKNERIAGVILHIDSPGGSAVVSDLLHHEVQRLAAQKPVIAWMGNVAASGGYYLAAGAHRITADVCTVTGSIGVISAHVVAEQLLARIGVRSEVVKSAPYADLGSMARPLHDDERALLARESMRFYERFLDVVARGRRIDRNRIAELAQGRVWSGADAQAHGLVDTLGGYPAALQELRSLLEAKGVGADYEHPVVLHPARAGGLLSRSETRALLSVLTDRPALAHIAGAWELVCSGQQVLAYCPTAAGLAAL